MDQSNGREIPITQPPGRDCSLLIFSKLPTPGKVFTRLQPVHSKQFSAGLHAACLRDTLDMSRPLVANGVLRSLYLSEPWNHPFLDSLEQVDLDYCLQQGETLGERLCHAVQEQFHAGYRRVIVIGTDTPLLDRELIRHAFAQLAKAPLVLGPTEDGGYYLIGLHRMQARLFEDIEWGSTNVLNATIERARELGLVPSLLPQRFDVDTPEDIARIAGLLEPRPERAPHVAKWLMSQQNQVMKSFEADSLDHTGE